MFTSLGLFKGLPCPGGPDCTLGICLFSHDPTLKTNKEKAQRDQDNPEDVRRQRENSVEIIQVIAKNKDKTLGIFRNPISESLDGLHEVRDTSRSKPVGESKERIERLGDSTTIRKTGHTLTTISEKPSKAATVPNNNANGILRDVTQSQKAPDRTTSPKRNTTSSQDPKVELLQPRLLTNPPATHPVRFKLLVLVHEQMERLNKLALASRDPNTKALQLSKQELITLALDEEQHNATTNLKVYTNIMKNRVGTLKKADLKAWLIERTAAAQKQPPTPESTAKKRKFADANQRVATGLSYEQEVQVLAELVSTKSALKAHGYVMEIPSEADVIKSEAGIKAANAWEQCDRCGCRFQAFPTRRENDGAITTGGSCRHHWGRLLTGPRNASAKPTYTCCQQEQGQPGCEEKPTHVFKVSGPSRLASVIQFEETPEPANDESHQPLSFDCEMAYTSFGMELVRLTATAWPAGTPLLDVLVRPRGEVLDLNTRFSGVTIQQWTQAQPWTTFDIPNPVQSDDAKRQRSISLPDATTSKPETISLPIIPSIQHARSLFFKLISPSTPLIGHALENDLIALRIVHPTIIDTVILFPHRRGLPLKNKLKFLVRDEIKWTIQDNDAEGHDSLEDALAAGELVRHKVGVKWAVLQRAGWRWNGNKLCKPKSIS